MRFSSHYALLLPVLARAAPVVQSNLDVSISTTGATVDISVTNHGAEDVDLFTLGSVLSPYGVNVAVSKDGKPVRFRGLFVRPRTSNLSGADFTHIGSGETKTNSVDISTKFDTSSGGEFQVTVSPSLRLADEDFGLGAPISLPAVTASVTVTPGALRKRVLRKSISPRQSSSHPQVQANCVGDQLQSIEAALDNAAEWIGKAKVDVENLTSIYVDEYFRVPVSETSDIIRGMLIARIANLDAELTGTNNTTQIYCGDDDAIDYRGQPSPCLTVGVVGFANPETNQVALCGPNWEIPASSPVCQGPYQDDQTTNIIHELMHCNSVGIVDPGLTAPMDYAYTYEETRSDDWIYGGLVENADSYGMYAKGVGYELPSPCPPAET
ncbi:hypothetical protein P152DRAFT_454198 [Eremomyces bilateralis CBS 781.70]|uniref:deuterolysin n=1 Tax=Eremomyces bilateralis CBS 781.70 TaxID=1392243 RepID=A0A6G1GI19_9PEZI|nr:uncharacterized protein P152DRAFT_454198 [Eremomyces bilateralis CBS 781.70]KAF1817622.1 hypothetical protein P152DRAFT_454198 [Eremomyces bilateralis CBS 781.70]